MSGNNQKIGVEQKIYVAASSSLDDVNAAIDQTEPAGPLVAMTNGKDDQGNNATVLIFDLSKPGPAHHAKAQPTSQAQPPTTTKVCQGTIYVSSTLTDCTAYRAN